MCTSLGGVLWKELINQIIEKEVKNKVSLHVWRLILLIIEEEKDVKFYLISKTPIYLLVFFLYNVCDRWKYEKTKYNKRK